MAQSSEGHMAEPAVGVGWNEYDAVIVYHDRLDGDHLQRHHSVEDAVGRARHESMMGYPIPAGL